VNQILLNWWKNNPLLVSKWVGRLLSLPLGLLVARVPVLAPVVDPLVVALTALVVEVLTDVVAWLQVSPAWKVVEAFYNRYNPTSA
jgi:hypothetical protein